MYIAGKGLTVLCLDKRAREALCEQGSKSVTRSDTDGERKNYSRP